MLAACRILSFVCLCLSAVVRAQWDEGMDPREEEYFAARMRQPHHGNGGDMWQQPQQQRGALLPTIGGLIAGIILDKQWGRKAEEKVIKDFYNNKVVAEEKATKLLEAERFKYQLQLEHLDLLINDADQKIVELQEAAKDAGLDLAEVQAKVDMQEFKQPDRNGDGNISRKEFNAYIDDYIKQYPHLDRKDMPKFEDFDQDKSGNVTFAEWQAYLERQRREEERQALIEETLQQRAAGRR